MSPRLRVFAQPSRLRNIRRRLLGSQVGVEFVFRLGDVLLHLAHVVGPLIGNVFFNNDNIFFSYITDGDNDKIQAVVDQGTKLR